MRISSNTGADQDAVSGFRDIHVDSKGQHVSLGSSNIAGMRDGASVANELLSPVAELVKNVKRQASNIAALAKAIEERDNRDASSLGGRR